MTRACRIAVALTAAILALAAAPANAGRADEAPDNVAPAKEREYISGGFEMKIFLDTVTGFQRFSRDPVTEVAFDGSNGGVLGEYLPGTTVPWAATPGQDIYATFVPKVELDIIKRLGERARLRADMSFGRPASGAYVNGIALNHAYVGVKLSEAYNVELLVGRFGGQAGYEPFRAYNNDTVSWSIMWRGSLYPPGMTGMQLSADLTNTMSIFFVAANGVINDGTAGRGTLPSFLTTLEWTWGAEAQPNQLVITPWFGPESGDNRPFTYGGDVTFVYWIAEHVKLGLEGCYQRNNAVLGIPGAENTDYASGLVNLRWDITPAWYGVVKYVFARQFAAGNGILNLTGAKQNIHESSIGFGYQLTDASKFKGEFRFDVIDPAAGRTQTIPGAAFEYAWFF